MSVLIFLITIISLAFVIWVARKAVGACCRGKRDSAGDAEDPGGGGTSSDDSTGDGGARQRGHGTTDEYANAKNPDGKRVVNAVLYVVHQYSTRHQLDAHPRRPPLGLRKSKETAGARKRDAVAPRVPVTVGVDAPRKPAEQQSRSSSKASRKGRSRGSASTSSTARESRSSAASTSSTRRQPRHERTVHVQIEVPVVLLPPEEQPPTHTYPPPRSTSLPARPLAYDEPPPRFEDVTPPPAFDDIPPPPFNEEPPPPYEEIFRDRSDFK